MPDPVFVLLTALDRLVRRLGATNREPAPVLDAGRFPWLATLSADSVRIRTEALNLFRTLEPADTREINDLSVGVSGSWRLAPLIDRFGPYPYTLSLPATLQSLRRIPALRAADLAVLAAHSRIDRHVGDNWGVLRSHVTLVEPEGSRTCALNFPTAGVIVPWHSGDAFVFDDTFEHEAVNERDSDRLVLLIEIDRPLRGVAGLCNRLCQHWYRHHPVQRGVRDRIVARYEAASGQRVPSLPAAPVRPHRKRSRWY